jgi:hypothetical protein
MVGGPAMSAVSQAFADSAGGVEREIAVLGFVLAAVCFAALRADGVRIWRWGRAESVRRTAAVFAVGGALWVLPASWSIPDSVLSFPFNWLLLTVPFALAAVATAPRSTRRRRVLAVAPLAATALAWPTLCGMAAADVRHQAGMPADGWFALQIAGYTPYPDLGGFRDGAFVIDYDVPDADWDFGLTLESWPATAPSPCEHFQGPGAWAFHAQCTAAGNGTWSVTDEEGLVDLVGRRGAWYVAVETPTDVGGAIAPGRLPAILATVHVADDHEVLAAADGS